MEKKAMGLGAKASRCMMAALLALLTAFPTFAVQEAYAADSVYLEVGSEIEYAGYFTNWFSADGNMAYCANPSADTPASGTYGKLQLDAPSGRTDETVADLWFGYGSPGFDESLWPSTWYDGTEMNDARYAVLTHILIADTFSSDGEYALAGTNAAFDSWCRENVIGFDSSGNLINTESTGAKIRARASEVPDSFDAFMIETGGSTQVMVSFDYSVNVKLQKGSTEEWSTEMGDYSFAGAQYGVYTSRADAEADTNRVDTLTVAEDGTAVSGNLSGDGDYYVKETAAPEGYALDEEIYVANQGNDYTVSSNDVPKVAPVDILLLKTNDETGGAPQGSTQYEGAKFHVAWYDGHFSSGAEAVSSGTAAAEWDVVVDSTDSDGLGTVDIAEQLAGSLWSNGDAEGFPLGYVTIQETESPKGLHSDGTVYGIDITDDTDDYTSTVTTYNTPTFEEQTFRGDFKFNKINEDQESLAGIPFKVTSLTTGESHVIVTDANGEASTEAGRHPHTSNTNANDAFLTDGEATLDASAGIWFSQDANGETSAPDNTRGALPYDEYEVEELECDANTGSRLVSFTVSVTEDGYCIDLGTKTDPDVPGIQTEATDASDGDHEVAAEAEVVIEDAVSYTGLTPGKEYVLTGSLMDKSTGEPILEDGTAVTAQTTFTPSSESGVATVSFTFDASQLGGHDVVAFESLTQDGTEVAAHADIDDEGQTVTVVPETPEIKTTATDADDGDHEATADDSVTIEDEIEYSGLTPGKEYTMTGTLVDKSTGEPVKSGGSAVTSTVSFAPEKSSGTVSVTFEFDGSSLAGHDVVAFETLKSEGTEVAAHADIDDEGQTVHLVEKPETPSTETTTNTGSLPKTGDSIPWLAIGLLVAAAACCGGAIALARKRAGAGRKDDEDAGTEGQGDAE